MAFKGQIPFSAEGHPLEYDGAYPRISKTVYKDNFVFEDTLIYTWYRRGRSSCVICFKGKKDDIEYSMFMSEFDNVMKKASLINWEVTNKWTFTKKGANYSVCLA